MMLYHSVLFKIREINKVFEHTTSANRNRNVNMDMWLHWKENCADQISLKKSPSGLFRNVKAVFWPSRLVWCTVDSVLLNLFPS